MSNIHFSKTLKKLHPSLYQEIMLSYPGTQPKEKIWNYCHQSIIVPICVCGQPVKFSNQFQTGYNHFCSCRCAQNSESTRRNYRQTMMANHGVTSNFSMSSVIEQKKHTWLRILGVDNPAKSPSVQKKIENTVKDRYGPSWRSEAFKRNMLRTHGVENWVQSSDFYQRFSERNSNKKYLMPSGTEVHIQGCEGWALDILLAQYLEHDIKVHAGVPTIFYLDIDQKKHAHYPDIFIEKHNLLIEVKSGYTYNALLEKNHLKAKAALSLGFTYQFWVFDRNKNLTIIDALEL